MGVGWWVSEARSQEREVRREIASDARAHFRPPPQVHCTPDTMPDGEHNFDSKCLTVLQQLLDRARTCQPTGWPASRDVQEGTGSVRFVSLPDFSKIHRFGSVRFGSFPRPNPAGSRIKRFGSVRFLIPSRMCRPLDPRRASWGRPAQRRASRESLRFLRVTLLV